MAVLLFLVLWLRGDASPGDLVAYITAAGLLPKPIRQLSEVSATIQKGLAGAESIFAQIDEPAEIDRGTLERDRVDGRIEVCDLGFTYPGSSSGCCKGFPSPSNPDRWWRWSGVRAAASRRWPT
jgi:ATP-binding cassette, subfamily B, bacterial MsbA